MLLDFRALDDGTEITADLCIIGGGAAGIVIANEFANAAVSVCLVESGGLDFDDATQALYNGENTGRPYYDLDAARLRYFGGTTNHWSGRCGVLNRIDLVERPWVPHSGWPLTEEDLASFYPRAAELCRLGSGAFDERAWQELGIEPLAFTRDKIAHRFWRFSRDSSGPTNFGHVYRAAIERRKTVKALLNANVVDIRTDGTGRAVECIEIRSLSGRSGTVKARHYVLACGGIENARILLYSNKVEPAGLGNRDGLVGRYFMEHPHVTCAMLMLDAAKNLHRRYNVWRKKPRQPAPTQWCEPAICLTDSTQRENRVLNAGFKVNYDYGSATRGKKSEADDEIGRQLWRVSQAIGAPRAAANRGTRRISSPQPERAFLLSMSEQAPNPDSRVVLSKKRDALGLPRVDLNWRLTELDKRTLSVLTKTVGSELARLGVGRVRIGRFLLSDDDSWQPSDLRGGNHHIGTTRMATDTKKGVVDRNCRVHGVENLYIAGSSVFPTSGYVNPTLTIVALSIRLADHLKTKFI